MLRFAALIVAFCASVTLGQDSIGCFVPGECIGSTYVGISVEQDANNCLESCKDELGCQYFTYYSNSEACIYFITCGNLSTDGCTDCSSGDSDCEGRQCDIQGLCDGKLVEFTTTANQQLCVDECDNFDNCNWWSYDPETLFCLLSEDCAFIDTDYTTTVAGQKGCTIELPPDEIDLSKILLIGGHDETGPIADVDLVDLDGNSTCNVMIDDLPMNLDQATAVNVRGDALVCGGVGMDEMNNTISMDKCWRLTEQGNWTEDSTMNEARSNHQSLVWEDGKVWVLGGRNSGGAPLITTELYNGTGWEEAIDMPHPDGLEGHCIAQISGNFAILTGGSNGQDAHLRNAYLYEYDNDTWTELPDMIDGRSEHTCEVVETSRGLELIVAGGGTTKTSVDIFSFPTQSWELGTPLPKAYARASTVPYNGTFLMFGGGNGDPESFYDDVLMYDKEGGEWVEGFLTMSSAKYDVAAVMMDSKDIGCNEVPERFWS